MIINVMKHLSFFLVLFLISGLNRANCQYRLEWKLFYSPYPSFSSYCQNLVTDTQGNFYAAYTIVTSTSGNSYCETVKYSAAGDSIWHRKFILPTSATSGATIAIDMQNNVYVAGYQHVLKYDENGNLLWIYNGFGGYANIYIDAKNNVYLNGSGQNTITAKLDSNGIQIWSRNYLYGDFADFTVDKNKNVYTAGTNYSNDHDYYLVRYNSLGDSTWVRKFNGSSQSIPTDILYAVAVDSSCNAYITGSSEGSSGIRNLNVIKYDSLGNLIWERRYGNSNTFGGGYDIKVDKEQNIIVTGILSGNVFITLKYSNNGDLIWEYTYTGNTGNTIDVKKMFVDMESGEVYILVRSSANTGFKIICLSRNGTLNWTAEDDVVGGYPYSITKDRFNNIYVVGFKSSSVQKILIEKFSPISTGIFQPGSIPEKYSLSQNFPNPFNPVTRIDYSIPLSGLVSIKVYDALGRSVKDLVNDFKQPGNYSETFDASSFASGFYYYTITANNFTTTKKMILSK